MPPQLLGKASRQTSLTCQRPLSIVPLRFGGDTARGLCPDSHHETAKASRQSQSYLGAQISVSISESFLVASSTMMLSGIVVVSSGTGMVSTEVVVSGGTVIGVVVVDVVVVASLLTSIGGLATRVDAPEQPISVRATSALSPCLHEIPLSLFLLPITNLIPSTHLCDSFFDLRIRPRCLAPIPSYFANVVEHFAPCSKSF